MKTYRPSEQDLHAYLDDQLDPERRRWVESWLAANPEQAAQMEGWRDDARRLRASYATPEQWPV
ncbi:MAG: anti-sigma factor family protein, partial [Halomonas sp.]|uniref:anti-sigma factor family protein n=1 Tax=Halomonas sp. TaxID=1486246 RepID=UPI003F8F64C5